MIALVQSIAIASKIQGLNVAPKAKTDDNESLSEERNRLVLRY